MHLYIVLHDLPSDIKYQFAGGVYKIGAVDNTGCVANWTLQDDTLTLLSETDAPDEMLCFALLPPTVDGDFTLYGIVGNLSTAIVSEKR